MLKRAFDITVALIGLVILLPFLLLVALLIKLDSPGSVFFRQERVGMRGVPFRIFKFRTMVQGAHKMGSRLTTKRDPRVTRVGQFLRWFKIDETLQLINVLVGQMSVIGPRPEDPHFVKFYDERQRGVLSVRPGMLGPSQILGRDELESYPEGLQDTEAFYLAHILPEKLERDLEYVKTASFAGDLLLLARGVWATAYGAIKTKFLWRRRHRVALFLADIALIVASCCLAFVIRFDFSFPADMRFFVLPTLIIVVARAVALMYFGAYQGVFAYFGLWDLVALSRAVAASAVVGGGLVFFVGFQSFPRSVFVIDLGDRALPPGQPALRSARDRPPSLAAGGALAAQGAGRRCRGGRRADRPSAHRGSPLSVPTGRFYRRDAGKMGVADPRGTRRGRRRRAAAGRFGQPDRGGFRLCLGYK